MPKDDTQRGDHFSLGPPATSSVLARQLLSDGLLNNPAGVRGEVVVLNGYAWYDYDNFQKSNAAGGRVITFSIVTITIALAIGFICGYAVGCIRSDVEWKRIIKRTAKSPARKYFG